MSSSSDQVLVKNVAKILRRLWDRERWQSQTEFGAGVFRFNSSMISKAMKGTLPLGPETVEALCNGAVTIGGYEAGRDMSAAIDADVMLRASAKVRRRANDPGHDSAGLAGVSPSELADLAALAPRMRTIGWASSMLSLHAALAAMESLSRPRDAAGHAINATRTGTDGV